MRRSRAVIITALVASAAMVFAGCGSNNNNASTTTPSPTTTGGGAQTTSTSPTGTTTGTETSSGGSTGQYPNNDTIKYAYEQEWYSYNGNTSSGNATANAVPLNQVLDGFVYIDPKSNYVHNTDFGTFEKVSDNPLTVKYTLNPKAVWSDGVKIDCADWMLNWVANSGWYNTDGTINKDPANADPTKLLFQTASTTGYDQTEKPTCKAGDQSFTLVYSSPFVDWEVLVSGFMPAHVALKAAGMTEEQFINDVDTNNVKGLTKVANFWNTGWNLDKAKGLPAADIIPADGPYYVAAWQPGQSLTLKANPKWWGTPAKTGTVIIRFIAQEQQVQALQNGDVDIIGPQPTPDITSALKALGSAVKTDFYDAFTYEHMDLSTKNAFKNKDLREALFKCVPRQQIVDNLIKPANPNAEVLNSLMWMPFQSEYANAVQTNGFSAYNNVDIAGAKAAFQASGAKQGLKIRVIHITPNQRRDNEVALLKASCDPVGFDIENTPLDSNHFGGELSSGNYDIALFAWAGSGLFGSISALYTSNGSQNYSGWGQPTPDKTLDDALNKVNVTLDKTQIPPLLDTADQQLAKNLWSVPLFAFPSVTAWRPDIEGVQGTPIQSGDTWNMQDWVRQGK